MQNDYALLRKRILDAGLLERQPLYYASKIAILLLLIAGGIAFVAVTESMWWHLLGAAYFAFLFGQIALLFHDACHRQIFGETRKDDWVGYAAGFCIGTTSPQNWMVEHNRHHAHPNREDTDPDIDLPFFAYSEKQAAEKKGFLPRLIMKNQGLLYFPLLSLTAFSMRVTCVRYLLEQKTRAWLDASVFALHLVLYVSLLFLTMPWWHALLFIAVHQILLGIYLGSIFAPNHKGMPLVEKDAQIDFVREQVLTSRNVRSNPLIDYWYGGLNFQIEHHLFPTMPRNNLRKARKIIKEFCIEKEIPYHETGVIRSYREIVSHMSRIAAMGRMSGVSA